MGRWAYLWDGYGGPVRSSIPPSIERAEKTALETRKTVERLRSIGFIAILGTSIAILYGGYQLTLSATSIVQDAESNRGQLETRLYELSRQLDKTSTETEHRVQQLEAELVILKEQINQARAQRQTSPPAPRQGRPSGP
jgi:hypothetical protein